MTSFISSLEIFNFVIPDSKTFFRIAGFLADVAVVDPNSIKTLLGNGLITFFMKGKRVFSNGPKSLSTNPPDCPIFYN